MLEHGAVNGLPALVWTIATSGAITGEADGLTATADEQRAAVHAWAACLGATVDERVDKAGAAHLYARWSFEQDGFDVGGCIRATIHPAD
ncbi:hypothetical protein [Streptomyces sp. CA2R101]|uniref:hypothetical protein n=1 Tax=Streptomyces sp. CA2R101 TaxID=3120152 RepID=UPI00300A952A